MKNERQINSFILKPNPDAIIVGVNNMANQKLSKSEISFHIDKNRKVNIDRVTFPGDSKVAKFFLQMEDLKTGDYYKLPGMTKKEYEEILKSIEILDDFAENN